MMTEQKAPRPKARTSSRMGQRTSGQWRGQIILLALAIGAAGFVLFRVTPGALAGTAGSMVTRVSDDVQATAQEQLPDTPQPQNSPPSVTPSQSTPDAPSAARPGQPAKPEPPDKSSASTADPAGPRAPSPAKPSSDRSGGAPDIPGSARNELYTLTKNINFVLVPVTVKNNDGRLVEGLLQQDFSIYEDGAIQKITFFTSDPFPLSTAVVLDTALPQITWKKIRATLPALVGAFSQFDEVALFTYSNIVRKVQDFSAVDANVMADSLRQLKRETGTEGGVPVVGGPMTGVPSPSINGQPVQAGVPPVPTYPKQYYVLNDAILAAANDLGRRDPQRRKVIFVVSDGRETGSANGYNDVMKVLLSRGINVYAIDMASGIPGYDKLKKVRIPGQGYGDILPKYASATGGQVFSEFGERALEEAYSRVTEEARNQYSLGYTTPLRPSSNYRSIEVRVRRPNLKVYARDGYYPLPPAK
jgi:VWFA-related protein